MATTPLQPGTAPANPRVIIATPAQTALVAHFHSFYRRKLERTIEALITICDLMDPDVEAELELGMRT